MTKVGPSVGATSECWTLNWDEVRPADTALGLDQRDAVPTFSCLAFVIQMIYVVQR